DFLDEGGRGKAFDVVRVGRHGKRIHGNGAGLQHGGLPDIVFAVMDVHVQQFPSTLVNPSEEKPDCIMTSTPQIENTNVSSFARMPTPVELHAALPLSEHAYATVMHGRETLRNILDRKDKRLF